MPTSIAELFEVDGLQIGDKVNVVSGSIDPHVVGYYAPIGSMYLRTNGETWKKIGLGDKEWQKDVAGGGGGYIDDDSMYQLITRSILVTNDYTVEVDVGTVSFNHYYEDGVTCTLDAPNYYSHDVTIKNLSGNTLSITPLHGRIDGKRSLTLSRKYASITLRPLQNDWVLIAHMDGKLMVAQDDSCCKVST